MSNYQLQVLFDRKDRTYQFNELISGRVVLDTQASLNCRKIWIKYGWRTHGKGNVDKGGGATLDLCLEPVQFRVGEHKEYPFRFRVPNGPVTYHGHIVNVDWYITAQMDIPFHLTVKNEQDFLLIANEAPVKTIQSDKSMSKDEQTIRFRDEPVKAPTGRDILPGKLTKYPIFPFIAVMICGCVWLFYVLVNTIPDLASSNHRWYFGSLFFGVPVVAYAIYAYGLPVIKKTNWKRNVEISDLRITPDRLHIGDQVTCRLQFQTKRLVYLDNITATLSAEEVAVQEDSGKFTYTQIAYKKSFVKTYREDLVAGRLISFDCVLPVLPGAPTTFQSTNNEIKWSVNIKIVLSRRSSWEKTIPITIVP